jgi:hypothetical protein
MPYCPFPGCRLIAPATTIIPKLLANTSTCGWPFSQQPSQWPSAAACKAVACRMEAHTTPSPKATGSKSRLRTGPALAGTICPFLALAGCHWRRLLYLPSPISILIIEALTLPAG